MISIPKSIAGIILVAVLLPFLISGCGDTSFGMQNAADVSIPGNGNVNTDDKVRIKIANWSTGYSKEMQQLITEYNAANIENIEIVVLKIARDRYSEIINMLMASGKGPDVFSLNPELIYSYTYKNWLVDLSKYLDDGYLNRYPSWALNYARDPAYGGSFYTVPSTELTFRLIYNKDLFKRSGLDPDKPPTTFDELRAYAKKITDSGKGDRKYGFALPFGEEWVSFIQSMEMPNTYSGVYYYDFKEGRYDLSVYEPWFSTVLDMKKEGSIFPGDSSLKNDSARAQFAEGNIGMMFASSWDPAMLSFQYPAKCDWDVALPPGIAKDASGRGAIQICAGTCYSINAMSMQIDKAVEVWKFLNSYDYLSRLYKNGEEIPVFSGIIEDPDFQPSIKNFEKFKPTVLDSPYPNAPRFINDWIRINTYISVMNENDSIDPVLKEESDRLNTMLEMSENAMRGAEIKNYTDPGFDPSNPLNIK